MTDSVTFDYLYFDEEFEDFDETPVTICFDYRPEELSVISIDYDTTNPLLDETEIKDFFFENFDILTDY